MHVWRRCCVAGARPVGRQVCEVTVPEANECCCHAPQTSYHHTLGAHFFCDEVSAFKIRLQICLSWFQTAAPIAVQLTWYTRRHIISLYQELYSSRVFSSQHRDVTSASDNGQTGFLSHARRSRIYQ